jgi:hypothetical protein
VLRSANNRGKIASTSEGIAFYFREITAAADFELTATANVVSFDRNNQVAFGLMLRDKVLMNESSKENLGSYIAVGPVNTAASTAQYTFRRGVSGLVREGDIARSPLPDAGLTFTMSLRKAGDTYVLVFGDEEAIVIAGFNEFELTCNGKTEVLKLTGFFRDTVYAGVYAARKAEILFTRLSAEVETRSVTDLRVDAGLMKTIYLPGESLDLKGSVEHHQVRTIDPGCHELRDRPPVIRPASETSPRRCSGSPIFSVYRIRSSTSDSTSPAWRPSR